MRDGDERELFQTGYREVLLILTVPWEGRVEKSLWEGGVVVGNAGGFDCWVWKGWKQATEKQNWGRGEGKGMVARRNAR